MTFAYAPLLIGAATLMFAWPALYNRYPLLWYDTCAYLQVAWHIPVVEMRSPFYGYAIEPLLSLGSVWFIAVFQSALVASMIYLVLRAMLGQVRVKSYVILSAFLALLTGLSWHSSLVMADVYAGLVPLGIFLLAFARDRLARWELFFVLAVTCLASLVHYSHLALAAIISAAAVAALFVERRPSRDALIGAGCCIGVVVISTTACLVLQWRLHHKLQLSPNGSLFLLARLVEDGSAKDYLAAQCPTQHFALCAVVGDMPMSTGAFLWFKDGPVNRLGGPDAISNESSAIVAGALRQEPLQFAWLSLGHTLRQLSLIRMDEVRYFNSGVRHWQTCARELEARLPADYSAQTQSRQFNDKLGMDLLFLIQVLTVIAAGILLLGLICADAELRADWRLRQLAWLILVCIVSNAAICGALSEPDARYQSRVIWLLPFLLFIAGSSHRWVFRQTSPSEDRS